ncbi:MAG: hypothetical protein NTV00_17080 [Methylococcales bacterium]|nr:hypothetical protein [Methylococcales bacterium]
MKKNNLTLGVLAVLLLNSTLALAESDYPAADFQPKVLFHDSGTTSTAAETATKQAVPASSAADSNYPAADFQPKVVFQDDSVSSKASVAVSKATVTESAASETAVVDSAYPAADFQPKVLYNDATYKASASNGAATSSVSAKASTQVTTAVASDAQSEKSASSDLSLIGIGILALIAGIAIFRKSSAASIADESNSNNSVSGVARYLAARDKNAVSGVARYLAKQAEAKITGVEAYLRNRG